MGHGTWVRGPLSETTYWARGLPFLVIRPLQAEVPKGLVFLTSTISTPAPAPPAAPQGPGCCAPARRGPAGRASDL